MLTVLFATHNGARTLPGVLDAYRSLAEPEGGWQLVIVDNASTDRSREIVASYEGRLPTVLLREERRGKNWALRTGLRETVGDLVVFTDDDAFPEADWLVQLRTAADDHPDYAIFGGSVLPRWETPPPEWIRGWVPLGPTYTVTPSSLPEGPTDASTIFGPNMAVRREVFEAGHSFDGTIGPAGGSYAMGSETELVRRLLSHGYRAWHVPGAVVEHFIPESHMEMRWVLRRAVRYGRGTYRMAHQDRPFAGVRWRGVPRYMVREMLEQVASIGRCAATLDSEGLFHARWRLNVLIGQAEEARSMGSVPPPRPPASRPS